MQKPQINKAIPLESFMDECLKNYYTNANAIGASGDFITAPEVSQLFGESIGLWFLNRMMFDEHIKPFVFAEFGPGRGVLLGDVLKVFKLRPTLMELMELQAVEIHPTFKGLQTKAVAPKSIQHHSTIQELLTAIAPRPLYCMANEFFDTYPIEQYIFQGHTWLKRAVVFDGEKYCWTTLEANPPKVDSYPAPKEGDILEVCPSLLEDYKLLQEYILKHGGALLSVDYGYTNFLYGDSFQALAKHKFVNPLENPGQADLTAHVNFAALKSMTDPALNVRVMTQGEFLISMGIHIRSQQLIFLNPTEKETIDDQVNRLIVPEAMGDLFKVLLLY